MSMESLRQFPPIEQEPAFGKIVRLLIALVITPTAILLVIGILMLVFWRSSLSLVLGILVIALVVCLVTGSVIALVWLRREARLSRLQTDFVSKISHELKTPLTSIRLFAEMLNGEKADARDRSLCLEGIVRESDRLNQQIERLLAWGRMEAGQRRFERETFDCGELVEEAVAAFVGSAQGQDIPLRLKISEPSSLIQGDRAALIDALLNLLSNAAKYSSADKRIFVDTKTDGRLLRISVRDHGVGIPKPEHRRIFQKFYRVDERLSSAAEGTGLGLAIVQHIVQAHDGRVEVESEPGQGSTFTLSFPIATSEGDSA